MDKQTADKLNKLNQEFYLKTQEYFNRTRQFYWQGWEKLLPYLKDDLKVLDIGCGNGRFGEFLKERKKKIEYMGMDNNEYLLKIAKQAVPEGKFKQQDVFKDWQVKEKYDLVAILGVWHHLALTEDKVKLLKQAKKALKKDGVIYLSVWLFNLSKQFNKLKTDWDKVKIDKKQLRQGDYLLSWGAGVKAYRYCYLHTKEEVKQMVKEAGLEIVKDYLEDTSNWYLILKAKRR